MSVGALRVPTRRELVDVARLAGPIVLVQLGLMSMGTVDTIMLGRVSPTAMAGGALGNWHWLLVTMIGQGAIQAIDPIVSQARGAGDGAAVRLGVQRGLLLGLLLALPAMCLLWPAEWVMRRLGQPVEVATLAGQYATTLIPSVLAHYWFFAMRQSLQALQRVGPILVTVLVANAVNAFLNWVFIFGNLGFPALGVRGAALATTIGRWTTVILLLGVAWPQLAIFVRAPWREARRWPALWSMLRLGIPIGIHQWMEIAAFGGALLLMGLFGTVPLAAHNLTIQIATLTYMVPLGTAAAAAVLVGHAIGRRDMDAARREASAALACGVGFMATCAALMMLFPGPLAAVFTRDPEVLALAARFLPIAAAFQVFDGIQGVSSGILRGAGDTRIPMLLNLVGFVAVGIPAAAWLAFGLGLGPVGIWWGLVLCLAVVATSLGWRVHTRLSEALARIER